MLKSNFPMVLPTQGGRGRILLPYSLVDLYYELPINLLRTVNS